MTRLPLLLLVLVLSQSSFAMGHKRAPDTCARAANDLYDSTKPIPSGKYQGQCIDTSIKRPAIILNEDANSITIANFRHLNQFWIAKVPKSGVQQVIFRIDRFTSGIPGVGAAHTLLRFKMEPGREIQLTPQSKGQSLPAGIQTSIPISDFFFSVDYMAPANIGYGLIQGEQNTFLTTERFISEQDRDAGASDSTDPPSQDIPLQGLSAETMSTILVNAVHRSANRGIDYPYNTFDYNCTTELFNLLDDSINYGDREVSPFKVSILDASDAVAGPSIKALEERGLIPLDTPDEAPARGKS